MSRKLLDKSIIESMPPYPSVYDVIAGERRRQRVRRGAGVIGVAAAVAGLIFAIQAGMGASPSGGPPVQPGQSSSGATDSPTNGPRTVAATAARLTDAFDAALSTVVPGATRTMEPSVGNDSHPGYTGFTVSGSVTTSQGVGAIQLTAFWPLEGVPAPTDDELAGVLGCRGALLPTPFPTPVGDNCEVHLTQMGPVALLQQGDGVNHEYTVAISYSDRGMVAITARNNPASGHTTPVLSLDQLRRIITDPAMRP